MSSPKYYRENTQQQKSHLWWEFQSENLYVCPKQGFGHTYKVSAWNSHHKYYLCNTQILRIFWRARETLVKQPPDPGCLHLHQWPMTYLMTLSDWTMSCQPWPPCARHAPRARYKQTTWAYKIVFSCDQAALWMVQSVRLSVRLSVTPYWLCSHHWIITKFSGIITNDRSDVHANGQGQRSRSQRS